MARMTPQERQKYLKEQKLKRQKQVRIQFLVLTIVAIFIVCGVVSIVGISKAHKKSVEAEKLRIQQEQEAEIKAAQEAAEAERIAQEEAEAERLAALPHATESANMAEISHEEIVSEYAIVIDKSTDEIIAAKKPYEKMYPASMTKILTVLTAAENISPESLDDRVEISHEAVEFAYKYNCSTAGFEEGEVVTVRDLFYGTILPSGGEAAAQLGIYVAGSMDDFVMLMNYELEKLGLSDTTHVTNMIGVFDTDHFSTAYDIAMILEAAMENEITYPVMCAHVYTSTSTEYHPEGIVLSNWFLRRIEDKDFGGTILGAKTGYVKESGNCSASCETADSGKIYYCVTAGATSSWRCIYDHVELYNSYCK